MNALQLINARCKVRLALKQSLFSLKRNAQTSKIERTHVINDRVVSVKLKQTKSGIKTLVLKRQRVEGKVKDTKKIYKTSVPVETIQYLIMERANPYTAKIISCMSDSSLKFLSISDKNIDSQLIDVITKLTLKHGIAFENCLFDIESLNQFFQSFFGKAPFKEWIIQQKNEPSQDENVLSTFEVSSFPGSKTIVQIHLQLNMKKLVFTNCIIKKRLDIVARPRSRHTMPEKALLQLIDSVQAVEMRMSKKTDDGSALDLSTVASFCEEESSYNVTEFSETVDSGLEMSLP